MTLHELTETLRLKLVSAHGKVLLVTQVPTRARTEPGLTIAKAVPESSDLLKFAIVIFVRPFDEQDEQRLRLWRKRTNAFIGCYSTELPLNLVIQTINARLAAGVATVKPAAEPGLVSMADMMRTRQSTVATGPVPAIPSGVWTPPRFDPEDPSWIIPESRRARFAEAFADPNWQDSLTESRRLAKLAKRYNIGGKACEFREHLEHAREIRSGTRKRGKLRGGDTLVDVLRHFDEQKRKGVDDALKLRKFLTATYKRHYGIHTVQRAINILIERGLIMKIESMDEWLIKNVDPNRKTNADGLDKLAAKAHSEGRTWKSGSMQTRLNALTAAGRIPPPTEAQGWARPIIEKLKARILELEARVRELESEPQSNDLDV